MRLRRAPHRALSVVLLACVGACQVGDPGVERSRGVLAALEGRPQALRLTCESRCAADLLAFHGLRGTEAEVFARLPKSDNPDLGFVGDPDGEPGQLPPAGYGVHAAPLAQVLRGFGLAAVAQQGRDLAWLRAETDQDRPVIVWITASCGDSVATPLVDGHGRPFWAVRGEHVVLVLRVRETVLALDPATGHRVTFERRELDDAWALFGRAAVSASGPRAAAAGGSGRG